MPQNSGLRMTKRASRIPSWVWGSAITAFLLFGWSLVVLIGVSRKGTEVSHYEMLGREMRALADQTRGLMSVPREGGKDTLVSEKRWREAVENCRTPLLRIRQKLTPMSTFSDRLDTVSNVFQRLTTVYPELPKPSVLDVENRWNGLHIQVREAVENEESIDVELRRHSATILSGLSQSWQTLGLLLLAAAGLMIGSLVLSWRDSRHRRRAEGRLRATEERYQNIYLNGPLAIVIWDPSGRIIDWNHRAEAMFGWVKEDAKDKPLLEFIAPASRDSAAEDMAQLLRDQKPVRLLTTITTRDGRELVCETYSAVLHDDHGQIHSIVSSTLDVTESQRSAAALRQSEARFRGLFESNLIGIMVGLDDGAIDDANDVLLTMVGYTRDDLNEGRVRWDAMTPPEYHPLDEIAARELAMTGVCTPFEKDFIRKDGSRVPVLIGATYFDAKCGMSLCFVLDLTYRREAEARALASGELIESIRLAQLDFIADADLRRVFDSLLESLLILTQSRYGFIDEVLQSSEDPFYLLGTSTTNIGWHEAGQVSLIANDSQEPHTHPLNTLFNEVVAKRRPLIDNHPTSVYRSGDSSGEPLLPDSFLGLPFFHGETLVGVIGIANRPGGYSDADVAYLEPLLTTCASLVAAARAERRRTQAEADLHASKEAAETANQAKDRFLAVLSHELRTPLTPVLAAVTSARDDPATSPELRELCEMVGRNVELEARLIDDLLDVSRINRGLLHLDTAVVNAHTLIREVKAICLDDVVTGKLNIEMDLEAEVHYVDVDPARFQQVIWNLIKNAVKFTPPGGTITVRTRNAANSEKFSAKSNGLPSSTNRLIIEVSDTGIGLDPADISRIFLAFEQGDSSVRRRVDGLGLGLAISRSVVEAHGGTLLGQSKGRDQGSTFTIELATVPVPIVVAPPSIARVSVAPRQGLDILLVEDNKDTLYYLSLLLEQSGHSVRPAATLADAIKAADSTSFDLLLSDIELPDGTGLDLIRYMRTSNTDRIPAIAMSGFGSDDDIRMSLDAGFFNHLTKPIDLHRLHAAIDRAVSGEAINLPD